MIAQVALFSRTKKMASSCLGLALNKFLVYRSLFFLSAVMSLSAFAGDIISAGEAYSLASHDKIILVDIRSKAEWKETGIASVARPISMHESTFLPKLLTVIKEAKGRPIALICATGGRSAWLKKELTHRGVENLLDVSEGMLGSVVGSGWIRSGLPIKAYSTNTEAAHPTKKSFWEQIAAWYKSL